MSFQKQISLNTKGHGDMHDITDQVATAVNSSGVKTGIVNVFNVGTQPRSARLNSSPGCAHARWTKAKRNAEPTG